MTTAERQFQLNVNGKDRAFTAHPDMPLLWVLRDTLGLKGAKYGCGKGLCGSCTVHLDGKPVRSCTLPVGATRGTVTTVEGLADDHPVIAAWEQLDVPQCGYCQPGQIMSAAALLAATPRPDDDAIDRGMSGNICRCGTYNAIRGAIRHASRSMEEEKAR